MKIINDNELKKMNLEIINFYKQNNYMMEIAKNIHSKDEKI